MKYKTHCVNGHPWTKENVIADAYGAKLCIICKKANDFKWQQKKKLALELKFQKENPEIA